MWQIIVYTSVATIVGSTVCALRKSLYESCPWLPVCDEMKNAQLYIMDSMCRKCLYVKSLYDALKSSVGPQTVIALSLPVAVKRAIL